MAGIIISGLIFGLCAIIMFVIGVSQINSKKPVGFYSGEKTPDVNQLTDVDAWNKKHGMMWIIYGFCIVLSWICGLIIGDSILVLVPFSVGLIVPVIFMIYYHNILITRYYVKHGEGIQN